MEVVLQWLDELDDLVFAGFTIWRRLRRFCLATALGAALALYALPRLGLPSDPAPELILVTLASLAAWGAAAALSALVERGGRASAA